MLNRLALATVMTVATMTIAIGQTTDKAEPQKSEPPSLARSRGASDNHSLEQKWVEESIDKFFAIPNEIFDPQPARR